MLPKYSALGIRDNSYTEWHPTASTASSIMSSNNSNRAQADNNLPYAGENELDDDMEYEQLDVPPISKENRRDGKRKGYGYSLASGNMSHSKGDLSLSPLYARSSGGLLSDGRRTSQKVSGQGRDRRNRFPTSLRRGKHSDSSASSKPSTRGGSFQALADGTLDKENALANYEGNMSMAAAAQVVAASGHQGYKNFKKGENVLVPLKLLNIRFEHTEGPLSETTISPVNKYGYPAGKGKTREENKQGPFVYVIAQVESVHFGENAPYYYIKRADTGENQRVDQGKLTI